MIDTNRPISARHAGIVFQVMHLAGKTVISASHSRLEKIVGRTIDIDIVRHLQDLSCGRNTIRREHETPAVHSLRIKQKIPTSDSTCGRQFRRHASGYRYIVVLRSVLCIGFASWAALASAADQLSFNRDVRPLLSDRCFACHGPDEKHREADLRLDERESATTVIVPGQADDSELIARITSDDVDLVMPPPHSNKTLTNDEKQLLRKWINTGADFEPHWSLVPLQNEVPVPRSQDDFGWVRNEVDAFVLNQIHEKGLVPTKETTREQWLRRVTFDLTGLPPTPGEIDAFLTDHSVTAYETVVLRLFESPAYGERMAVDWLDAARYADTFGYQSDRNMHVWPWRDWVIRAFNENLPYDQFILWQIAGDMLDEPTPDQRLATAFNRLHRQTNEGGSIEAEFRAEYVADRLRTVGTTMLGLTLECSRCHDHKYDPIPQREYYQLSAFFNNIDEHGLYSHFTETAPTPAMLLYKDDQRARHRDVLERIAEKEQASRDECFKAQARFREHVPESPATVPAPIKHYDLDDVVASGDYLPVAGQQGAAVRFGGDDAFVCSDAPVLARATPFSLSMWVRPEEYRPRMIVIHQSRAAEDSAFRGFSLVLDRGRPVVSLIHFWPGNAIRVRASKKLLLDTWTHLSVTYSGSSRAGGVKLYLNGRSIETETVRDSLTRDIVHRKEWGDSDAGNVKLSLGARFRSAGFRNGAVDELSVFELELSPLEVAKLAQSEVLPSSQDRFQHYLLRSDTEFRRIRSELQVLRVEENELISEVRQIMTMEEMPQRRQTFVLARGAYDAPTDPVAPATPAAIMQMPEEYPRNRLGFARWLIDPRNPLTARVAVNRFWRMFFGAGIVASPEDFGSQGKSPTHPELLDWLARRFVDGDWNVQGLCRTIVLSATYRQNSTPHDPGLYQTDPANRLLARGPRHRLTAEQLRDNALAVSGLLVRKIGGPSVFPYQPEGLWKESGTGKTYSVSEGADLYRRSMYTFWRRTSPPPTMTVFDAPSREFCLARREQTETPMQALVLLNDPQFVEASRVLAERLIRMHEADIPSCLREAFRLLTSRQPTSTEMKILEEMYASQKTRFAADFSGAQKYVSIGEWPRDDSLPVADHAALTAVVQLMMSFDESVKK